jgi:hypothetical protein
MMDEQVRSSCQPDSGVRGGSINRCLGAQKRLSQKSDDRNGIPMSPN